MRWIHTKAFVATTVAVAVAAVGVVVGLVVSGGKLHKPTPIATSPAPSPAPVVQVHHRLRSPFTGEPVKSLRRVLAVKIDNIVFARPQTGIALADIVYVIPVEGGLTRFMAIFSSHVPPVIGPVRSTRQDDVDILRPFGRPGFAFSGAQGFLLPHVEHARIVDLYANRVGGYFRSGARIAPYNLYARSQTLLNESKKASKAHNIGFTFGAAPPGGQVVKSKSVTYPAASYRFTWSKKSKHWLVWIDGRRAMTTAGRQMAPATVVLQYTTVSRSVFKEYGVKPPFANSIGHGGAVILRDGRAYAAKWSRRGWNYGTKFTTPNGKPMNFERGQVWVLFLAKNRVSRFNESQ
jgi:DUF3048 family protein